GEAGIGKTRLALELERRVSRAEPGTRTAVVSRASTEAPRDADLLVVDVADAPSFVARTASGALVVVVARELGELSETVDGVVELGPLEQDEVVDLAASIVGARVLNPDLVERLSTVVERSPFFVEQTVKDWLHHALVTVRDGVASIRAEAPAPPRTLRALVEA